MKKFRKEKTFIDEVKFKESGKSTYTQVKGETSDGRTTEEFNRKIKDPYDPDLESVRSEVVGRVADVIGIPSDQKDDLRLTRLKIKSKNNTLLVKATIRRTIEAYDEQVKIDTPWLDDVANATIHEFQDEAFDFLVGNKRAQQTMAFDQGVDQEDDLHPAVVETGTVDNVPA